MSVGLSNNCLIGSSEKMPSLQRSDDRFTTNFKILDGGSGTFSGVIDEPNTGQVPSYQFTMPRRQLRIDAALPVAVGAVVQTESGQVFMLGHHGDAMVAGFRSFRLFEADKQYSWKRRQKGIDAVTGLETDTGLQLIGQVWGAFEPSPEMFDRQFRATFETARFITNAAVSRDDLINEMKVTRSDIQLGLRLLTLG